MMLGGFEGTQSAALLKIKKGAGGYVSLYLNLKDCHHVYMHICMEIMYVLLDLCKDFLMYCP